MPDDPDFPTIDDDDTGSAYDDDDVAAGCWTRFSRLAQHPVLIRS